MAGSGERGKKSEGRQAHIPVASRAALLPFPDLLSPNTSKAAGLRNDNPRNSLARSSVGRWQTNQLSAAITVKGLSIRKGKSRGRRNARRAHRAWVGEVTVKAPEGPESEQRPQT